MKSFLRLLVLFNLLIVFSCKKQQETKPAEEDNLKNGLIAYYPFNSNTNDESGNGLHLTNHGATLVENRSEESNKAYLFDGTSSFMIIPPILKGDSLREFTISLWVKLSQSSGKVALSFRVKKEIKCSSSMSVTNEASGVTTLLKMPFYVTSSNCDAALIKGEVPVSGSSWYHVALVQTYVHNNSHNYYQYDHYVNNKQFANSGTIDGELLNPVSFGNGGIIGGNNNSGDYNFNFDLFKGVIDDIRIYDRALSESEIKELYELKE